MEKVKNWFFNKLHSNTLIYNCCWEDPRCDRALMEFDKESQIVMITSAGCNALDYLLDDINTIHCVDMNYRQNALLELKKAFFKAGDFETLFHFFGKGYHWDYKNIYKKNLAPHLSERYQTYWNRRIRLFNGRGLRKSFYYRGSSGLFAYLSKLILFGKAKLKKQIDLLFEAPNIQTQQLAYTHISNAIDQPFIQWIMNKHFTMSLLGVPRSQQQLFIEAYPNGTIGYIQECLSRVFYHLPSSNNYFYRVYAKGAYSIDCAPNYLKANHFERISNSISKVHTYTSTLSDFLEANPGKYSHFVLLDHQDWLAENNLPELEREWKLILENSQIGTKILLRSAAKQVNFIPDFARHRLIFKNDKAKKVQIKDRVGTYASTIFCEVIKVNNE